LLQITTRAIVKPNLNDEINHFSRILVKKLGDLYDEQIIRKDSKPQRIENGSPNKDILPHSIFYGLLSSQFKKDKNTYI